jgi:hypothetical protein
MSNTFVLSLLSSRANCIERTQAAQSRFVDGAIVRTHTFEWFPGFKLGELWLKVVSVQVIPP